MIVTAAGSDSEKRSLVPTGAAFRLDTAVAVLPTRKRLGTAASARTKRGANVSRVGPVVGPPAVIVSRPILPSPGSVNHSLPSAPVVIELGPLLAVKPGVTPARNSVTLPFGLIRATAPGSPVSVNQMLPSGPAAIPLGLRLR